jgi:hypothetical protein
MEKHTLVCDENSQITVVKSFITLALGLNSKSFMNMLDYPEHSLFSVQHSGG